MSSYVVSPYVIEQRRLQGIVDSCRSDLKNAMDNLREQHQKIVAIGNEISHEDYMKQSRSADEINAARQQYSSELAAVKAESEHMKSEIMKKINHIMTQIKIEKGMDDILSKSNEIVRTMRTAGTDIALLKQLEKQADSCTEEVIKEIKKRAESTGSTQDIELRHVSFAAGEKGISLGNIEETGKRRFREKISDIFARKLASALASPNADRIPSLRKLKKGFDSAEDYEKDIYAKKNEQELDRLIEKLNAIESSNKSTDEKRTVSEKRYAALCGMLGITPDNTLLSDKSSTVRLDTLNKEMFAKYKKKKEHEYLANALSTVLKRHNIEFQDSFSTEHESSFSFGMEHAQLSVSSTNSGILSMQVTGVYSGAHKTADDVRKSVSSASQLCSSMKQITDELASEFGIHFQDIRTEEPSEETIAMVHAGECASSGRRFRAGSLKYDSIGG